MPSRNRINVLLLAFVVVLTSFSVAAVNWVYHMDVSKKLDLVLSDLEKEPIKMIKTTWISGGKRREWTSTRSEFSENETIPELIARHEEELAAVMILLPEDDPE